MISSKTNLTLYWDPNFVSSQQLWLLMINAQIDADLISRSIFDGDILVAQDPDLPKGLWFPILKDQEIASEGIERCFQRLIDFDNVKKLRGPAWLDGRAYGLSQKAISIENHLLLVEGEFLYYPYRSRPKAGLYAGNIKDRVKDNLIYHIVLGKISPEALKISLEHIHQSLLAINTHLSFQLTLNSDEFGLADILWLPVIRRLQYMQWPLKKYSEILPWYKEASAHFHHLSRLDKLEKLPPQQHYRFWQKINWLGGRNLQSSLNFLSFDKKAV